MNTTVSTALSTLNRVVIIAGALVIAVVAFWGIFGGYAAFQERKEAASQAKTFEIDSDLWNVNLRIGFLGRGKIAVHLTAKYKQGFFDHPGVKGRLDDLGLPSVGHFTLNLVDENGFPCMQPVTLDPLTRHRSTQEDSVDGHFFSGFLPNPDRLFDSLDEYSYSLDEYSCVQDFSLAWHME